MPWDPEILAILAGTLVVGVGVGFAVGRRTGQAHARILELQARVETLSKERESVRAELEARKDELRRAREEHEAYRGEVSAHFSGTSDLLRDLTLQYRAVYDHLARGAGALCPEGAVALAQGLESEALPEPQAAPAKPAAEPPAKEPERSRGVEPLRSLLERDG